MGFRGPTEVGTRRADQRTRGIPAGKPWSNPWFRNRLPIRWSARECLCAVSLALPQDVEDVKFVINFDYPNSSEDYIHRIGRTGRCEQTGTSYAFFTPNNSRQARDLVSVLREANQKVNPKLDEMASMRFGGGGNRFGNARNRWGGGGNGFSNTNGYRGGGNRNQGNRWSDNSFGNGISVYKS